MLNTPLSPQPYNGGLSLLQVNSRDERRQTGVSCILPRIFQKPASSGRPHRRVLLEYRPLIGYGAFLPSISKVANSYPLQYHPRSHESNGPWDGHQLFEPHGSLSIKNAI